MTKVLLKNLNSPESTFSKMFRKISQFSAVNYEYLIGTLAGVLVFRKPATIAIIVFTAISLLAFDNLKWRRKYGLPIVLIALPVLLDVFFLWNNVNLGDGFKHLEKRASLLLFPVILLCYKHPLDLRRILKVYSSVFTILLIALLVRFAIIENELFIKLITGDHPWEMGYTYAKSMNLHAPAVNMHVAFLVMAHTFIIVTGLKTYTTARLSIRISLLLASLFLLLYLNTRVAVSLGLLGMLVIVAIELGKRWSRKKVLAYTTGFVLLIVVAVSAFAKAYPFMIEKYTTRSFANLDMIGRLDEFENPEITVYSSLVTRLSIWKTSIDRASDDLWIGVGAADGKDELNQAYVDTDQKFLATYKFPTHNQYIDFLLKFGLLGFIATIAFMLHILWISIRLRHTLAFMFFVLFTLSNLTDDYLIRFDGITFSALWISLFATLYWRGRIDKDQLVG